jgi:hypothetical protein
MNALIAAVAIGFAAAIVFGAIIGFAAASARGILYGPSLAQVLAQHQAAEDDLMALADATREPRDGDQP